MNQGGGECKPVLDGSETDEDRIEDKQHDEGSSSDPDESSGVQRDNEAAAAQDAEAVEVAEKEPISDEKKLLIGAVSILAVILIALFWGAMQGPPSLDESVSFTAGLTLSYPSSWDFSGYGKKEANISSEDGLAKVSWQYYKNCILPSVDSTEDERYKVYLGLMDIRDVSSDYPDSLTIDGYPAYKLEYEEDSSDGSGTVDVTELVVFVGNNIYWITASCEAGSSSPSNATILASILDSATIDVNDIKVTFKDGQGNEEKMTCLVPPCGGLVVAPDDFTQDGYVIDGWSCDDEDVTVKQDLTYGYLVNDLSKDTTLEAVWAPGCTVTFEDGSGNVLSKQTVKQGSSATAPTTPTKTGCTFIGWDKDFSNVESDMTVVANWGYDSGSYRVGADIPAGEYKMITSGSAYYCVYPDLTKNDILENGNFTTVAYMTLTDGQLFELNRGTFMPVSSASATTTLQGDGIYKVGLDLPAGQYKLTQSGGSSAYYAVLSTVDAAVRHNIANNDNFQNSSYIEVHDGQYLELSRCVAAPVD